MPRRTGDSRVVDRRRRASPYGVATGSAVTALWLMPTSRAPWQLLSVNPVRICEPVPAYPWVVTIPSRCFPPLVAMVEAAEAWQSDNLRTPSRWRLDSSWDRIILVQSKVRGPYDGIQCMIGGAYGGGLHRKGRHGPAVLAFQR